MSETEPESGLREVVHQRVRLGVLAVLDRRGRTTFSELRDALGQSDGGLSRHLGVLEEHGYIVLEKVFENRRPRTWASMTEAGAAALREEQELLSKLLSAAATPARDSRPGDRDDPTIDITIAFAALLAVDEQEPSLAAEPLTSAVAHSALVPADPRAVRERDATLLGQGQISANYDFPPTHSEFGDSQRAQRLMMRSHALRGGWITSWQAASVTDGEPPLVAHAMVVELGAPADCAAILAVMGTPSLPLPETPDAYGYLDSGLSTRPDAGSATATTTDAVAVAVAVAWFSIGAHLAAVVVTGAREAAVELVAALASDQHRHLFGLLDTRS